MVQKMLVFWEVFVYVILVCLVVVVRLVYEVVDFVQVVCFVIYFEVCYEFDGCFIVVVGVLVFFDVQVDLFDVGFVGQFFFW